MLRAGEAGRIEGVNGDGDWAGYAAGSDGGALFEIEVDDGRAIDGIGGCASVAEVAVGVACGVDAAEFAFATEIGAGVCLSLLCDGGW